MYIDASRAKRNSVAIFSRFAHFSARFPTLKIKNVSISWDALLHFMNTQMSRQRLHNSGLISNQATALEMTAIFTSAHQISSKSDNYLSMTQSASTIYNMVAVCHLEVLIFSRMTVITFNICRATLNFIGRFLPRDAYA